ncbi:hypothetical protein Natpe_3905 (plasmid) [Natrinema pellirubrum DSM 15624]|uniref:Uncharacterized protein n=1 Tax=Natrinema pellirubrum (strain DSM 15624 / CIP 106293 / JCM 10476 / NCIMB 786 / 157) TaxID=797303 RepID=L0JQY2_NATP1|nr:hypothetical protein Natpe_3905 [Natrinema pellirubrum DSM 15624]
MAVHNDQLTHRALSLAPSRAPLGASESAPQGGHPTSTARRPARSERPAGYARSCPARYAGPCPGRLSPRTRAAVWRAPAQAAQSAGTRKPARGATDGDTRWRRGHIHFSPERALTVRRAPARPEWSVASDAEGGSGERGEPLRITCSSTLDALCSSHYLVDSERARPLRSSPDSASTEGRGAQRGAWDAERLRAFGMRVTTRSRSAASSRPGRRR